MSTVICDLYRINFDKEYVFKILTEIELLEVFEPIEPVFKYEENNLKKRIQILNNRKEKINEAIKILNLLDEKKNKPVDINVNSRQIKKFNGKAKKIDSFANDIVSLKNKLDSLNSEKVKLTKQLKLLKPLKDSKLRISKDLELFNTKLILVSEDQLQNMKFEIDSNSLITYKVLEDSGENRIFVLLVYDRETESLIKKLLKNMQLKVVDLDTDKKMALSDYYNKLKKDLKNINKNIKKAEADLVQRKTEHYNDLKIYSDLLGVKIDSLNSYKFVGVSFSKDYQAEYDFRNSEILSQLEDNELLSSYLNKSDKLHIDGWINPDKVSVLKKNLKKISDDIEFIKLDNKLLKPVRSSIKNKNAFRPFEVITQLMGTPDPNEIDPSPYVAPFFIAFFGFALGDAGYGLVMSLVSYIAMKRYELSDETKQAVKLMLYCGLSTILFGTLTGGWFGANLNSLGTIGAFLEGFKVFDIASNIMIVLVASLAIGFIHQLFGLSLQGYNFYHNGEPKKALWVPGTWALLLVTIVTYALRSMLGVENIINWNILLILVFALFAWGQGYGTQNLLIRPLKGVLNIFNITSFLSNTLSYARLLALALATGVIAGVVNLLATLFSGDIPVVSSIIMAVILVIGHAFNLSLNLVGTFINVIRLHLVEFFPHFFEAKGVKLTPLKTNRNYTKISPGVHALDLIGI